MAGTMTMQRQRSSGGLPSPVRSQQQQGCRRFPQWRPGAARGQAVPARWRCRAAATGAGGVSRKVALPGQARQVGSAYVTPRRPSPDRQPSAGSCSHPPPRRSFGFARQQTPWIQQQNFCLAAAASPAGQRQQLNRVNNQSQSTSSRSAA
ncbi:hypothetical protein BV898_03584 [Hypsibius exemplaris]|uniref:Uncharacterized protein n=1 Tax=Hypsibius exemplaris TaxID=2072580 RepID=A0A1W0X4W9_HYPEX|nr:hypothetical protein BV898_03584 [Hypsibius exemplaris]